MPPMEFNRLGRLPVSALLWSGTAASVVDLHPTNLSGFVSSQAYGVSGGQQVGAGQIKQGTQAHFARAALEWYSGFCCGLTPDESYRFRSSVAYATDGIHQVGTGGGSGTGGHNHALLWSGSATSAVDLHPTNLTGYSDTFAFGSRRWPTSRVSGRRSVDRRPRPRNSLERHGEFRRRSKSWRICHFDRLRNEWSTSSGLAPTIGAMLWSGTAASALDLNSLLPFVFLVLPRRTPSTPKAMSSGSRTAPAACTPWNGPPFPNPPPSALFAAGALGLLACRRWIAAGTPGRTQRIIQKQ